MYTCDMYVCIHVRMCCVFACLHVRTYLTTYRLFSGLPNYGAGSLTYRWGTHAELSHDDASDPDLSHSLLSSQSSFYQSLATLAARSHICIDQFICCEQQQGYVDLATIKFLSLLTGE